MTTVCIFLIIGFSLFVGFGVGVIVTSLMAHKKKEGVKTESKYGPLYFVRGNSKNPRGVRYALSLMGVQAEGWHYNFNGIGFWEIEDSYIYFGYRGSELMRVPVDQQSWLPEIIMDTAVELHPTPPEHIPVSFFADTNNGDE